MIRGQEQQNSTESHRISNRLAQWFPSRVCGCRLVRRQTCSGECMLNMTSQLGLLLKHCSSVSFSGSWHQLMMLCPHECPWARPGKTLVGDLNMFLSLHIWAPKIHRHLQETYYKMSKKGEEREYQGRGICPHTFVPALGWRSIPLQTYVCLGLHLAQAANRKQGYQRRSVSPP